MSTVKFLPEGESIDVPANTKLLVAARKAKADIVFGCASCRCGTCGVRVEGDLQPSGANELELLEKMNLPTDGSIRLACQARTAGAPVVVDLTFQSQYSPDTGLLP